ncbi:hypothetical protein VTN00DRAFT_2414 [Thermoascus crustaceus]|uniref:uncharacterized protein n=1 Tax=Thermoascus crustaceus TaxID=5088 RepID=UPI003742A351
MESEVFQINEEIASSLREIDDDELRVFSELHEDPTNDEEIELFIFTNFNLYKRTGDPEWAQRAMVQTDLWLLSTPLEDEQSARRYRIANLIRATACERGHQIQGDSEVRAINDKELLQGTRYRATDSLDVLNVTIEVIALALNQMPPYYPRDPNLLMQLAKWSVARYHKSSGANHRDLQNAINIAQDVTAVGGVDPHTRAHWLFLLGKWEGTQYFRVKDSQSLDHGIDAFQHALSLPFRCDALHTQLCLKLVSLQLVRFTMGGKREDLDECFSMLQKIIENPFISQDDRASTLNYLATSWALKYMNTEKDDDMTCAAHYVTMALKNTPSDHPARAAMLSQLEKMVIRLYERYESTDCLCYRDQAIEMTDLAVQGGDGPFDLSEMFRMLGQWLNFRYESTGSLRDLHRAIEVGELAAQTLSSTNTNRLSILCNLSTLYGIRFERQGDITDINHAVELAEKTTEISRTQDSEGELFRCLATLGTHLLRRLEGTGRGEDLHAGHRAFTEAIDIGNPTDPLWNAVMKNFASCLHLLFDRTANRDYLNRAIDVCSSLLDKDVEDHFDTTLSIKLSQMLKTRSRGNLSKKDLPKVKAQVIEACIHHRKPLRFQYCGDFSDINKAIDIMNTAIQQTNVGPRRRAQMHQSLASCLTEKYFMALTQTGPTNETLGCLNGAIDHWEMALKETPQNHPRRASCALNLAQCRWLRFYQANDEADEQRSIECYREGWDCVNALPSVRVWSASILASNFRGSNPEEAASLLQEAVQLLPTMCPKYLNDEDKQSRLQDFFGLASQAAAVSLEAGKSPADALQVLETGRAIISSLLLDMRTEISQLKSKHPHLAERFEAIRDELSSESDSHSLLGAPSSWELSQPETGQFNRQHQLHEEFEQLIVKIRDQDGFSQFLLPPTADEFEAAAHSGPIVVINAHEYRCDAIIVETGKSIRALRLDKLNNWDVAAKSDELTLSNSSAKYSPSYLSPLLEWLWETAAKPILEELGIMQPPSCDNDWPHVWWVLTGQMANMPIHAAGNHAKGVYETVIDRVISSYSTSVKSLIHSRRHGMDCASHATASQDALITSMVETPHQISLPFAAKEISAIQSVCKEMNFATIEGTKRTDEILTHLRTCKIFHFAGHGLSDAKNPQRSCLLTEDWETNPLTVDRLRQQNLQESAPFLAYLSACSTVANKEVTLLDEGIHLISAIQLAGFRHAVGALWEVSDKYCVDVARVVYETLQVEGMKDEAVARGVHRGIRMIRDAGLKEKATVDRRSEDGADKLDKFEGDLEEPEQDVKALEVMMEKTGWMKSDQRDAIPLGSDSCEQQPKTSLFWIPFVHYGA